MQNTDDGALGGDPSVKNREDGAHGNRAVPPIPREAGLDVQLGHLLAHVPELTLQDQQAQRREREDETNHTDQRHGIGKHGQDLLVRLPLPHQHAASDVWDQFGTRGQAFGSCERSRWLTRLADKKKRPPR